MPTQSPAQRAQAAKTEGEAWWKKAGGKIGDLTPFGIGGAVDLAQGNLPGGGALSDAAGNVGQGLVDGLQAFLTGDLMKRVGAAILGALLILLAVVQLSGLKSAAMGAIP